MIVLGTDLTPTDETKMPFDVLPPVHGVVLSLNCTERSQKGALEAKLKLWFKQEGSIIAM